MSRAEERKRTCQIEKEAKMAAREAKGEATRVRYEERKKKAAQPNRVSACATAEEEMADRQDTVEKTLKVYRKVLPSLLKRLSKIPDPRQANKVKYELAQLMVYGILFFVFQISSRRAGNKELTKPILLENLKAMFPEIETLPHGDTLNRILSEVDVEQIQDSMVELLKRLIAKKKFRNCLVNKKYLIAFDGTQRFYRNERWAIEALERHVGTGEEKDSQYYVYVLDAVLILDNEITLPVMSEILENQEYHNEESKQDSERKAFYRLAKKIKEKFPRLNIAVLLDGLYACGPVFHMCRQYNWDFMIVLKSDCLKSVWDEFNGLSKIEVQNKLEVEWGNRRQSYRWVNGIDYRYGANGRRRELLHVVKCKETWTEVSRYTGEVEELHTNYAWISNVPLSTSNVFDRCTKMGRARWRQENNIHVEKHQGYRYQHCFSYNWNAMKGYHYLMKIGHFINVLVVRSELLARKVLALGIQPFIKELFDALKGALLDKESLRKVGSVPYQLRLNFSIG